MVTKYKNDSFKDKNIIKLSGINKKKVGILSMQRIANYGSFLQAYALKSILEELGANVQFVDYHIGKTIMSSSNNKVKHKLKKVIEVLKVKTKLVNKIRFINYKRNYAKRYYPYLGITNKLNFNPNLDLLVIGSDEVFNCVQDNTNVGLSPELFGQNNNAARVISYAASFGNTTYSKLKKYKITSLIGKWLKEFDNISVRDENSKNIVDRLISVNSNINLDPVLIYDFFKNKKIPPKKINQHKYILVYGYTGRFSNKECKKIEVYARKKGLKIYCIGGIQECCDKFINCNPLEVMRYFKEADCIVTDTFHGTIMSIVTHSVFVSIVRKQGYGNSEKLEDLLNRLSLKDRELNNIDNFDELINKKVFYDKVDRIIKKEREKSYEYLKKQLSE